MGAPCKNCPDRHEACWGHCEKYKQWIDDKHKKQAAVKEWKHRNREEFRRSEECAWKTKEREHLNES